MRGRLQARCTLKALGRWVQGRKLVAARSCVHHCVQLAVPREGLHVSSWAGQSNCNVGSVPPQEVNNGRGTADRANKHSCRLLWRLFRVLHQTARTSNSS